MQGIILGCIPNRRNARDIETYQITMSPFWNIPVFRDGDRGKAIDQIRSCKNSLCLKNRAGTKKPSQKYEGFLWGLQIILFKKQALVTAKALTFSIIPDWVNIRRL